MASGVEGHPPEIRRYGQDGERCWPSVIMPSVINEGGYGRFGAYSRVELERFFHLDDEDRRLIEARRRDYIRLGFALQVVTVRHLGMFLPDPLEVPPELVGYLAEQLAIEDPTCVKRYTDPGENQARTRLGDPARVWSDTVRRGRARAEGLDRRPSLDDR